MTANELNRIVVGVDGSDCARRAAQWAAREADRRALPSLTLLHAYGGAEAIPPPLHQQPRAVQGAALLETAVAHLHDLHPTLALETELSPLDPVARLAELSRSGALIVTGTSGHGALAGLLLGSVSRALAATAPGPLVVVRGRGPGRTRDPSSSASGPSPRPPRMPSSTRSPPREATGCPYTQCAQRCRAPPTSTRRRRRPSRPPD